MQLSRRTLPWVAAVLACDVTTQPPVPPTIAHQVGTVEAPADQHLLLFPVADAEQLLGREVQLSADGGWTIAGSRAPGCEVRPSRMRAEFSRTYRADLDRVASLAAGYGQHLGIAADYGTSVVADVEIRNAEVLTADFRGDCGTHVIDSVFVGAGRRRLERSKRAGIEAGANVHAVPVRAGVGSAAQVAAELSWSAPQAYAFTFADAGAAEAVRIDVEMPRRVETGERFSLEVTTTHDAQLIVYFVEADGRGGVLFPSVEHTDMRVQAGATRVLPAIEASLRAPDRAATETLVVYALTDPRDFERLSPPPGDHSEAGSEYAARLTESLADVPMRRWSRTTVRYVIEPAQP